VYASENATGKLVRVAWVVQSSLVRIDDPQQATFVAVAEDAVSPTTGELQVAVPFDVRQSTTDTGPPAVGGDLALVYNSATVNVKPIVETTFATDTQSAATSQIQVQLTWNGGSPQTVTFTTNGGTAGAVYDLAIQLNTAVTATGYYPFTVQLTATVPPSTTYVRTYAGYAAVVVNGSSSTTDPLGYGWSIAGVDALTSVTGGVLWVSGTNGARFFYSLGGGNYLSPPNDFGTLTQAGSTYTYTSKDHTVETFNSTGQLVSVTDRDGFTRNVTYSSGRVATITEPDGGVGTFLYDTNHLLQQIQEPGGRTVTVTHDASGNLTSLTNPDGSLRTFAYDTSHRPTLDQLPPLATSVSYDATSGDVSTIGENKRGQGRFFLCAPPRR
jgi:YD repeat-containing protein